MADQTQRLEIATVKAEVGSNILFRFANDEAAAESIPTDSGTIPNLKQVIADIQEDGAEKITISTTIYQSAAAGLAATADGGIFLVQSSDSDTIYTVWKNDAGAAVNTGKSAMSSQAIQDALTASNEAARAAEDAADVATNRTAGFLQPAAEAPVVRDDGLPLQTGDRYFNTEEQAEYLFKTEGWIANDSLEAIAEIQDPTDPANGAAKVGYDGGNAQDILDYAKPLAGYTALRAYKGRAKSIRLTNTGTDGWFLPSSNQADPDNNIVTIMDGLGRKWRRLFSGRVNVKWAGAKGDGSTDDSAAAQIALTYVALNKCTLYWPAGRYVILNTQAATAANDGNFNFEGDGVGTTIIELNTSGNGFELTLPGNYWLFGAGGSNGFRSSNITYSTTNASVGKGFLITGSFFEGRPGPMVLFENYEFRGKNSFSQFWDTAIKTVDVGDSWFTSGRAVIGGPTNTTGTFLEVDGTAQANSPVSVHITDPQIYYGGTQIKIGPYVEGVYVTQPHMVAGQVGLSWEPDVGESGLHLFGGHISAFQKGLYLNNLFDVNWGGTLIYRSGTNANWYGAHFKQVGRINTGAGMLFKGTNGTDGETGIYIESSVNDEKYGTMLAGIAFHEMGTRAIWLGANANFVQVGKNMYRKCALRVLNQSTSNNIEFVPATYTTTRSVVLTGGATTENYDLALPAGIFRSKPIAFGSGSWTNGLIATYDYDSASSTATNARFVISKRDGSVLNEGTFRVNLHCVENCIGGSF